MKQSRHSLTAAIAKRTLGSVDQSRVSAEIAAYLLTEHRSGELESLMRDVVQYRTEHGIVEVVALSAFDLTNGVRDDIEAEVRRQFPEARQIIVSHRIDQSIVAGVKLEFANQQLDMSVQGRLHKFKQLTQSVHTGKDR